MKVVVVLDFAAGLLDGIEAAVLAVLDALFGWAHG